MKCIIAGSRNINLSCQELLSICYEAPFFTEIDEIVSGTARGIDSLGEATFQDLCPIARFPAEWEKGRHAGYLRNIEMAIYADSLIAIWDEESKGTKNMIEIATKYKLKTYIKIIK